MVNDQEIMRTIVTDPTRYAQIVFITFNISRIAKINVSSLYISLIFHNFTGFLNIDGLSIIID